MKQLTNDNFLAEIKAHIQDKGTLFVTMKKVNDKTLIRCKSKTFRISTLLAPRNAAKFMASFKDTIAEEMNGLKKVPKKK